MSAPEIRAKAWWWSLVPLAGRNHFATTIGRTIYLPPKTYQEVMTDPPSVSSQALVLHETTHVQQYDAEGVWFALRYLFSRKSRLRYEVEAYGRQGAYLKQHGYTNLDAWIWRRARTLASWRYWYLGDSAEIADMLQRTIEEQPAQRTT